MAHTKPMTPSQFLRVLRQTHPDTVRFYLHGGCYDLFMLLRQLFPGACPYHSYKCDLGGHVAAKIDGVLYDIRGRIAKPSLYAPMTDIRLRRPYRWSIGVRREIDNLFNPPAEAGISGEL